MLNTARGGIEEDVRGRVCTLYVISFKAVDWGGMESIHDDIELLEP